MTHKSATAVAITLKPAPGAELAPIAEAAVAFAGNARSARTRDAYRAAWSGFTSWCEVHALEALPAAPETVSMFLTHRAEAGIAVATMAQALTAISQAHVMAGHDSPRSAPLVGETWKGIRRTVGTAQRQVAPVMVEDLRAMSAALPDSLRGLRDRALLVVGFAGAFRRSELIALELGDVDFTAEGLRVTVRRSKTDQEGRGQVVGVPYGSDSSTCPVRALQAWIDATGIAEGVIFRSVNRHGQVGAALYGRDVARIVKRAAEAAGLDKSKYSGHSLRAGLATASAKAGKSDRAIMAQGRWSSRGMVDRYVREARLLDADNAAAGIGL